jgi:hypothetical protein
LQFLDDDRMETTIGLMEFVLKTTTLSARLMKRYMSRDKELEEASERSRRSLSKNLIHRLPVQDR